MKINKLMVIALILFALICLPISFASESDFDSMGDASLDSLSINQINGNVNLECNLESDDSNLNEEYMEPAVLDDSNKGNIDNLDDFINENIVESDDSNKGNVGYSDDSNDENMVNGDDMAGHNLQDGNAIDYNSPNLSTNFTNLNVTFTDSNTIFVNGSYTGSVESGTRANPYKTFNAAFNQFAASSNTKTNIFLANGVYFINSTKTIGKNLNLVGESALNTIISGNDRYQLFKISPYGLVSPFVNVFNLTLTGGTSYYGGAIYINESGANFVNVNFINNTARNSSFLDSSYSLRVCPGSGGAIYIDKAFVKFYNASFIDNKALSDMDAYAGALFNDMGEVSILNSRFINNSVIAGYGAGGAIYDYSAITVLFNSTISSNAITSSISMGGGIATWASHNIYLLNSSIDNNKLYGHYTFGSAMINKANYLIMANTTISNNLANGTSDPNGTFFNLNGIVNSSNIHFENNIAKNPQNDLFMCLEDQLILERPFDDASLTDLPSQYNLKDYGLINPVIKDQGGAGACWTFATLEALESYLLKFENISYDFSENNMKNLMGYYGLNGTDWSDGGNHYMSLAYLLRWSGPVNETQDPYSDTSHSSVSYTKLVKHVQDVLYVPLRLNYLDINQIKAAIMTYGALYTTIHSDDSFQYNPDYYLDVISVSNHAITLVGWDDNYSADNFPVKPPGDGAFIIKNSWGDEWGYDGYWYISYYDKSFAGYGLDVLSGMAFTNVENASNYKTNYQYDILGNTFESIGFSCSTAWFANQFTAKNNNPLSAFGLYTYGDSDYLVNITVNGVVKYIQEGVIKGAGYHTIKLDQFVELTKDDVFRVAVKLTTPISLFPVAIESQRSGYSSSADAEEGQSFISPDGVNWYDLAQYNEPIKFYQYAYSHELEKANVCLKAYASGYADVFLNVKSNASVYYNGDTVEITLTVTNEGDAINDVNVSVILDTGVTVKSYSLYKGNFNLNTKVWHLDSLDEDESVLLKLKLSLKEVKDIITTRFNLTYSGYVPSNSSYGASIDIYYAGMTAFVQLENITTVAKSQDEVLIKLLDYNSTPLASKTIVISLIEKTIDGSSSSINDFTPVSLITDGNGNVNFMLDLSYGNYVFLVSFDGDNIYKASNMTFNVSVSKISSQIKVFGDYDLSNIETSAFSNDELKFYLVDDALNMIKNETIHLTISQLDQTYDLIIDDEGFFKFNLNLLPGNYEFLATFDGFEDYDSASLAFNVSVSKIDAELKMIGDYNLSNITALALSNDELKFCLVDDNLNIIKDRTIHLTINHSGPVYDLISDDEGFFKFNLNLMPGTCDFDLDFLNDNVYNDASLGFTVNVLKKASPVISIENNSLNVYDNLRISLADENGNGLANKILKLIITNNRGVKNTLWTLTDENGVVDLFNLHVGVYNISVIFENDDLYEGSILNDSFSVSKKETQIIFSNMNTVAVDQATDGRIGEYFNFKLTDREGNPIANVPMQIGFLGVVYDESYGIVTDENGIARLQINLGWKNDYTFAICFLGNDEYKASFAVAKINVVPQKGSLTVPNKSYSASAKTKTLTATFKSASGKPVSGKKITFTVNGKTYTAKTNAKGVASVNVSLTKKGTYSFTAKFTTNGMYATMTKTGKLTIK